MHETAAPSGPLTVGVDIGGTKVLAGVVDATGRVLARERRDTPVHSARAVEDAVVSLFSSLRSSRESAQAADQDVVAVGVGAAGMVGPDRSTVTFAPHLAWRDEPLGESLRSRLGLPVAVDNDANTAALAEAVFGAGAGHDVVLCVTVGTGIGADHQTATDAGAVVLCVTVGTGIGGGLVVGGETYRGANGGAGEVGHMQVVPDGRRCPCGNRGCWEAYASGSSLVRDARELVLGGSPPARTLRDAAGPDAAGLTGPMVTAAARAGDALSVALLEDVGSWLGVGLASLTAVLDPGCIVVGGGVSEAGELLLGPTRRSFERHLYGRGFRSEPPLVAAVLGQDAGFVGAAQMARALAGP